MRFILLTAFVAAMLLSRAQTDTLFWFAAPEISIHTQNFDRPIVLRITTYSQPATVTISQPAGAGMPNQVVNIPAGSTQSVDLTNWIDIIENKPPDAALNFGLKISSTTPVTAYYEVVSSQCQCNPEIFVLKGQNALGVDFWIPSQNYLDNNAGYSPAPFSAFDIVATQNNTTVTITPSNAIVGHAAGATYTVTLNEGQTYSATAASGLAAQHLQGSRVIADKPVAITVKDDLLTGAPFGGCADLGGDQIVPTPLLGTEYIAMNGFLNPPGDQLFITATQNGTTVSKNGTALTTLNAGQTYQVAIAGASAYIQTSAPAYVWQLSGFGCEIGMDLLPPIVCTGGFSVSVTRSTTEDLFVNVMVQNGGQGNFLVNGAAGIITAGAFTAVPGTGGQWFTAQVSLPVAQYPQGTAISITNPTSLFHLGVIHGAGSSGTRFGYFSNFSKFEINAVASAPGVCAGSSIQLNADSIPLAVYSWIGPSGFSSNQQNPAIVSAATGNSGDYIVTASVLGCASNSDTVNVTVSNCFPDSDNDGITDEYDIDDDNDGIPDVVECGAGSLLNLIVNGSFEQPAIAGSNVGYYTQSNVPGWLTTSSDTTIELWGNNFNGVPAYAGNQHAEINYTQMSALYQDVNTTPGAVLLWYFAHRGRAGVDVMQLRIGAPGNTQQQGQYSTGNTSWNLFSGTYIVPAGQTVTRFEFQAISTASGSPAAGNFIDDVAFYDVLCTVDDDNDGVPNSLDLDSDNDGIYDLVEAGHTATDANNDGRIDGPNSSFGQNGLFTGLENNDNINATITYTVTNTDGAGPYDFLSLNSDGDTCYDVVEAGYVPALYDADGYLGAGTPTVNANGVVQGNGGYTTPLNSTGGAADFQNINWNGCACHLPVTATVNPVICPNSTYTLPGGNVVSTSGTYVDTLQTAVYSCDSIITTNLTIATINVDAGNNTAICYGDSTQLNATGGLIYTWTPPTGLSNSNIANPVAKPTSTTTYTVSSQVEIGNSIINGDFNAGNSGFSSSYVYKTPPNTTEGQYWVSTNAQTWNGGMASCGDHTTGSGNMLLVNGATTPNETIWCQTVNVLPNASYAFSTWLMTLSAGNPAQLQFSINGTLLGSVFTASNTTCIWQQFYEVWNSGTNTTASICIVNQNTIASANDFAIDDISFSQLCTATDSVTVTVHNPSTVIIDTGICAGTVYTFPLGNTSNTAVSDTALLTDQFGCDSTVITNLTVNPSPTTNVFDTICANQTYTRPSGIVVTTGGVYNDTLTTALGCDSVIITNLTVNPVSNTTVNDTICSGKSYTLPDGNTVNTSGTYPVTLTNQYVCDSVITTNLTVINLTLTVTETDVLCFGETTGTITGTAASGITPYLYNLTQGGSPIAANGNGNFTGIAAGSYTVAVLDDYGCTASGNITVNEPALLQATPAPQNVSCFGEDDGSLSITATGGTTPYAFTNGATTNTNGTFNSLTAGGYPYTVTDANGCTDTGSVTITEPAEVLVTVTPNPVEIDLGESIQLFAASNYGGTAVYNWTPATGLDCAGCSNPTVTINNSLTYQVQVTVNVNGTDCYGYAEVPVTVLKNYDLFIPNVFTPNGDGNNDLFRLFGNLPALKFVEVSIFNRTGEKVFEANDINFTWDGTYKGKPLEPQVFVYTLFAVFVDNHSEEVFTGSLTLLK